MVNLKSLLTACGALAGLLVVTTTLSAWSINKLEYLTFPVAVGLPGVTLAPGTYAFELATPDNNSAVLVRDRATNRVRFLGLTYRVERPKGMTNQHVLLGEAKRGEAIPIVAWYPQNDSAGFQFMYRTK